MSMYRAFMIQCDWLDLDPDAFGETIQCSQETHQVAHTYDGALEKLRLDNDWGVIEGKGHGLGVNGHLFLCYNHLIQQKAANE